jgi:hypothetical protein
MRKGEKDGADYQELTASSREEFFKDCKSGGKYDGVVGIYRHNDSASTVGVFDKEFIEGLPESVKYICHNGAGYDQSESSLLLPPSPLPIISCPRHQSLCSSSHSDFIWTSLTISRCSCCLCPKYPSLPHPRSSRRRHSNSRCFPYHLVSTKLFPSREERTGG